MCLPIGSYTVTLDPARSVARHVTARCHVVTERSGTMEISPSGGAKKGLECRTNFIGESANCGPVVTILTSFVNDRLKYEQSQI